LRVAGVGDTRLPINEVLVNLRVKRVLYLPGASRKLDHSSARSHVVHLKAVRLQPGRYGLDVLIRGPKLFAKLCGCQSLMVIEQLLQRGLLIRAALQKKQHAMQGPIVTHHALVKLRARQRVHVSLQGHKVFLIRVLNDAGRDACSKLSQQGGE
jgi:hypothetical protein